MTTAASPSAPDSPSRKRGTVRKMLVGLVALAVVAGLAVVGYAALLTKAADDNLTQAPLLPTANTSGNKADAVPQRGVDRSPVNEPRQIDVTPKNPQPTRSVEQSQHGALNILVIGADKADSSGQRSDVIILAHISGDRQRVDLVHFPRDYYVNIPGYGYDKINASYAWGGAPLLVETVQEVTGVKIDHAAITDFEGFRETVDALGGVDVKIKESSPARGDSPAYTAGTTVHMDGRLALDFARQRKHLNQGDMGRGQRQMDLIAAIANRVMTPQTLANPSEMTGVVSSVAGNVTTDEGLGTSEIVRLAFDMRDVRGNDIHTWSAPWVGAPMRGGMSVVDPSWDQLGVLGKALVSDTMGEYEDNVSPETGF